MRAAGHARREPRRTVGCVVVIALTFFLSITAAHAGLDRSIEKMLGKQARDAVESQYVVIAKGPTADYVARIGAGLVAVSPRHDIQYTFKVLDTEQINAFALPYGYVYVTTGMLRFVDSSDELAGVMGHEIAHVAERHSVQQFKKQFWSTVLFGVIDAPATVATAGQIGATLYLLRYSRKDEQAADHLGADYSYLAGYDASQLVGFFGKLDKEQQHKLSTIEVYLSTHPTGERRQERLSEIPEVNQKDAAVAARTAKGFLDRHLANQAVVAYRKAVEMAGSDSAVHLSLAQAYAEAGEPDLARPEVARAVALGSRDTGAVQSMLAVGGARITPTVTALTAGEQERVKQTIASAGEWSANAQDPSRQLEERSKSLEGRVRTLARRMSMTGSFGRPTFESQRVLEKADVALYLIAETTDEIGSIAEGLKSASAGAVQIAQTLERNTGRPTRADDQAQWQALVNDMASGIARATEEIPQATQQASAAAKRAEDAAGQLASAVNTLASDVDMFGLRPGLTPFAGLAEGDVDRALKTARDALEGARKATAALRGWRTTELSWELSAAYLETPPAQRPALRNMAAMMIGASADVLTSASTAGFGAAVLAAIQPKPAPTDASATGGASTAPAAPDNKSPKAPSAESQTPPAGPKPSSTGGTDARNDTSAQAPAPASAPAPPVSEDLMLKLILADMKREAEARAKWQGSASEQTAAAN